MNFSTIILIYWDAPVNKKIRILVLLHKKKSRFTEFTASTSVRPIIVNFENFQQKGQLNSLSLSPPLSLYTI